MRSSVMKMAFAFFKVFLGTAGARAFAFVTAVILARTLGPSGFGEFSLFTATMLISWQIPQAFDTAFIRYAKNNDEATHIKTCLAATTRYKCLYALITVLLAFPLGWCIDTLFGAEQKTGVFIAYGLVCGSALSFIGSISSLMRVYEQFGRFALVQGAYNAVVCAVIALLAYVFAFMSTTVAIAIYMVAALGCGALCLGLTLRTVGSPFRSFGEAGAQILHLSKWVFLTTTAFYLFSRIDILLLPQYVAYADVGCYSAAGQITMAISVLIGAMSAVFMPRSIKAVVSKQAVRQYTKEAMLPIALVFCGIVVLYFLAPYCFSYLFSQEYAASTELLRILLVGYAFMALYTPFSFLFYALDLPKLRFYLEGGKLVLALVLLFFMLPAYGTTGTAIAMSIAMAVNSLLSFIVLQRVLQKRFSERAAA